MVCEIKARSRGICISLVPLQLVSIPRFVDKTMISILEVVGAGLWGISSHCGLPLTLLGGVVVMQCDVGRWVGVICHDKWGI